MARYGRDNYGSSIGDMTVGDYANAMPNIRIGEMFRSFGRQLPWVIILLAIGSALAWFMTKDIKRTYEGVGSVFVQQGEEHTYSPIAGGTGSSVLLGPEAITHAEVAIMKNNEVIERVIGQMIAKYGEAQFDKSAFEKINAATRSGNAIELNDARVNLHKTVENAFWVSPRPKTGIIDMGYKHENGDIAVNTLNAFIDEYLAYRRNIFIDGSADVFRKQATSLEEQLDSVEKKIHSFRRRNGFSNFRTEQEGASERTEALRAELGQIRAQMSGTEAEINVMESQLRNTPRVIDQEINDMGSQRVAQAELELKQLMAKYLPTSDPVRSKQAEIQELKSLQAANGGNPIGRRTVGPNPTHQALVASLNTLKSTADGLREREFTLTQLLGSNDSKVRKFQDLEPEFNKMLRERETLDLQLKGVNSKLQDALVDQEQAEAANQENVKVIAYATLPRKGRNMSKIMWALITIAWGFTLFMVALLKVFLDPRLYTDPTRRMRTRPQVADYASDDWGQDVPYREPSQPPIPEPIRPAAQYPAAQYGEPASAQPVYQAQPVQAQPYHGSGYAEAVPYVPGNAAPAQNAYHHGYQDSYSNPYAEPQVQAAPLGPGTLPSSEIG